MAAKNLTVADLARLSGVSYYAIDKLKRREGSSTSADNAEKLARAIGIKASEDQEAEELQRIFHRLPAKDRRFLLTSARVLEDQQQDKDG